MSITKSQFYVKNLFMRTTKFTESASQTYVKLCAFIYSHLGGFGLLQAPIFSPKNNQRYTLYTVYPGVKCLPGGPCQNWTSTARTKNHFVKLSCLFAFWMKKMVPNAVFRERRYEIRLYSRKIDESRSHKDNTARFQHLNQGLYQSTISRQRGKPRRLEKERGKRYIWAGKEQRRREVRNQIKRERRN
jgi:hypothetical protein